MGFNSAFKGLITKKKYNSNAAEYLTDSNKLINQMQQFYKFIT